MTLCIKIKPYKTLMINKQSVISSFILIITISFLENLDTTNKSKSFKSIIDMIILIGNMVFLLISGNIINLLLKYLIIYLFYRSYNDE